MKRKKSLLKNKFFIFGAISLFVIFIDQILKYIIVKNLPYGEPLKIMGNYIWITYIKNPFGVWGIPFPKFFPYEVIAFIIILILILFLIFEKKKIYIIPYSLLFGGAIGNLIDRLRFKAVIDFIDVGISENLRWPIFNIADSSITIGIILLFLISIFFDKK